MRSVAKHFTATASSGQGIFGPGALNGVYVHETGGAAAGVVNLRDGTDATGRLILAINMAAGGKEQYAMFGARFGQGVFLERTGTGTTRVNLFIATGT